MSTELLIPAKNEMTEKPPSSITQNIENNDGINAAYVERLIANPTILIGGGALDSDVTALLDASLRRDYCNLFIVRDVNFGGNKNCFTIPKDKALKSENSENFNVNDEEIKKFPSLFVTVNGDYKRCKNPNQMFYYGMVIEVAEKEKSVEICFRKLYNKPMPQQRLNEIAHSIGINNGDGVDMINHTNWLIKQLDIRKALTDAGIQYA